MIKIPPILSVASELLTKSNMRLFRAAMYAVKLSVSSSLASPSMKERRFFAPLTRTSWFLEYMHKTSTCKVVHETLCVRALESTKIARSGRQKRMEGGPGGKGTPVEHGLWRMCNMETRNLSSAPIAKQEKHTTVQAYDLPRSQVS